MSVRRCLGCMRPIGEEDPCPYCGYSKNDPAPVNALPPKTVLSNTYVVGKVLDMGQDGISYIGFDGYSQKPVLIREFMPQSLAQRQGSQVMPLEGQEAMYKALLSDFEELYTALSNLKQLPSLRRVERLILANNTCYVICEYFDCITLSQYLQENAGELDWEMAAPMFRRLMEDISVMHQHGVLHRGISPDSLVLTANGEMKLTHFTVSGFWGENGRPAQLAEGYAAPEQYSKTAPHGEWTDVYSLCAVLYKVLSGTMPPAADTRTVNDNLIPLNQLVEGVPPVVSQGIMAGLMVDQQLRLRSMRQLIQAVYYATYEAPVSVPQTEETTGEYVPGPQPEKKKNWFVRLPVWAKVLLICLPFVILVIVLLWVLMMPDYGPSEQPYSSLNSSSTSQIVSTVSPSGSGTSSGGEESGTSSAGSDTVMIRVDDLRSHQLEAVMNSDIAQQFNIVTTEEYSNTIENGFIISQSLEPGTVAAQGSTLELVVSKGKQNVIVPSYSGYSLNSYINELENLGFTVTVEQQYSDTVTSGSIIGTNPAVGTSVDRSVSSAITVYQSLGRDPATISSTPTSSSTPESSSSTSSGEEPTSSGGETTTEPDPEPGAAD
ncbi:MAG TPA: PASTA domain-containing protein [Candidatus Egerieicola faecale]|uniref:PASTA domain-containing protein n=1 Tax=Candidatus Egerieicola faecale TaxID=2840774 RepID=A0A9D1IR60_9FIRM|nr:PASTA domain-containing protein [Candidatus Egerieicola faecale]